MRMFFCILFLLSAFSQAQDAPLINYQYRNQTTPTPAWQIKLQALMRGEAVKFRILQLGDSHTAGGFFSDGARAFLQKQWGDGGIGFVSPNRVRGQRISEVVYQSENWTTLNSRQDQAMFPMGGVLSFPLDESALTLTPEKKDNYVLTLTLFSSSAQGKLKITDDDGQITYVPREQGGREGWFHVYLHVKPPFMIEKTNIDDIWQLGAIGLENSEQKGVIYSALGINGARLSETLKWRENWFDDLAHSRADLVVLAYGSNESMDAQFDESKQRTLWRETIARIRKALPNAGIVIIGAPEVLADSKGQCGTRAPSLDKIQALQTAVAMEEGILYWSWEEAMGGKCMTKKLIQQEIARKDGVHFTVKGYQQGGEAFARALIHYAINPPDL